MKTLTLTSEFFQNECAESFCKAILGNEMRLDEKFRGFDPEEDYTPYIVESPSEDIWWSDSITFKLDDQFSVDWACLYDFQIENRSLKGELGFYEMELNLEYLATLQGVIIEYNLEEEKVNNERES